MPEDISRWIEENFRVDSSIQQNLLYSLIAIVALLILRQIVNFIVRRRTDDAATIYRWRKGTEYLGLALSAIALVLIWLPDVTSLATYLGLLSAGLAIALQDPITDLVGWIFIIWRRPFSVGDRIEIGQHAGDVIDVRYFQFMIMEIGNWVDADQSTGRVVHIPNKMVFTQAQANYSKGLTYIWNEMIVDVTFESDWEKAKGILQATAVANAAHMRQSARERLKESSGTYYINYDKLTPIVYTRVIESGVRLTIRYLSEPRQRRNTENAMWEDILRAFAAEPTIEFAYPTERRFVHADEGPPALRPDAYYGVQTPPSDDQEL